MTSCHAGKTDMTKGSHPCKGVGQALLPAQLLCLVDCDYEVATQEQR